MTAKIERRPHPRSLIVVLDFEEHEAPRRALVMSSDRGNVQGAAQAKLVARDQTGRFKLLFTNGRPHIPGGVLAPLAKQPTRVLIRAAGQPTLSEERIVCGDLILVERPRIMTTQSRAVEKIAADAPIEKLRQQSYDPRLMLRQKTNAFHWRQRLKFQLRRPFVWAIGKLWRWWRP